MFFQTSCFGANPFEQMCAVKGTAAEVHQAIGKGDLAEVERLTQERGVESPNSAGITALMFAFSLRQAEIVDFYIQNRADVNAESNARCRPLHYAVLFGASQEAITQLLARGADKAAKDQYDQTAEDCARVRGNAALADYIAGYERDEVAPGE